MAQEFFKYRGYPLVRSGNQLYFGYMAEPYVVMMEIKHQRKAADGMAIADEIDVYKIATQEANPIKAVKMKSTRRSLFEAVDLAYAWIRRTEQNEAGEKSQN